MWEWELPEIHVTCPRQLFLNLEYFLRVYIHNQAETECSLVELFW